MTEIDRIIKASIFLALCILTSILQIPILTSMGLSIDFSLSILFVSKRIIGNLYTFIIAIIYPWFSMLSGGGGIIGSIFLFIVAISFLLMDQLLLTNKKNKLFYINTIIVIFILSIFFYLLNIFIFIPIWNGMDWTILNDHIINYLLINLEIYFPFNILKLFLNIYLGILIYNLFEKVILEKY